MSWRLIHKAVLAVPSLPVLYAGGLNFLATAASSDPHAKLALSNQVVMLAAILSSPAALLVLFGVTLLWATAVWFTDWMASRGERVKASLENLGRRAGDCAHGVQTLSAMHRQRQAIADHHAWANKLDRDFYSASATLLGDFSVLYQASAIAIFRQAIEMGVTVKEGVAFNAEHPTNPLGVEEVARELGVLADRIKNR